MFSPGKEVTATGSASAEGSPEQPVRPAVSPTLGLSLTVVYAVLYTFLFVVVYVQLWLILRYGLKRLSYQSALLFLCLLWAALRTTLFAFYFGDVAQANRLRPVPYWVLHCCPVCLQFFTLCLLNLYFAQVMFKAKEKYSPELTKYKVPLHLAFLCLCVFFAVVNLTCALLIQSAMRRADAASAGGVRRAVLARVLLNDSLFVLCAVSLSVCIFRIAKMSSANVYLKSKGTSVRQATAMGVLVVVLFTSRACYNLAAAALSPGGPATPFIYGWFGVSDQAEVREVSGETYIVFGVVLLFWELLPTALLVGFFRVQQPSQNLTPGGMINSQSFSSRVFLFDNPRRYDSEDDLTRSISTRSDRTSLLSTTPQAGPATWYGSIPRAGSLLAGVGRHPSALTHPPAAAAAAASCSSTNTTTPTPAAAAGATAPLLFAYPGLQGPQHHQHQHHQHPNHHNFYSTPQNNNGFRHNLHHHGQNHCCSLNYYCPDYYCTPTN